MESDTTTHSAWRGERRGRDAIVKLLPAHLCESPEIERDCLRVYRNTTSSFGRGVNNHVKSLREQSWKRKARQNR